jgi:hypothetical protein
VGKDFSLCVVCLDSLDIGLVYVGSLGNHGRFVYGVYLAIFLYVIEKLFFVADLVGVLAVINESKRFGLYFL